LALIFLSAHAVSCRKKDRLNGKLKWMVGTWDWNHTDRFNGGINSTLTPSTEGTTCKLKLHKNGKYEMIRNGILEKSGNIIIDYFTVPNTGPYSSGSQRVVIYLDGDSRDYLLLHYKNDTITTKSFPYKWVPNDHYYNTLVRE
ncbi:hypothetical protein JYT21_00535, partial [bacterium AH-315-B15]|nr:hypothetical protein [bacterium AH-315-B15]